MPLRPRDTDAEPPAPAVRARLSALLGLPPSVEEPLVRVDPGRRGVAGLALLAVAALAVTGAVVWRGRPRTVGVAPPLVVAPAPASAPAALLVVDVAGDVRRPGLVRLPPGSRVADALRAAGGVLPGAATTGLNLARKVVDGEQLLVGVPVAPSGAPGGLLDLNTATAGQLDALPGIGPVLAERIVAWRTEHGPFASVDQLREVGGIGERRIESLRDLVTV